MQTKINTRLRPSRRKNLFILRVTPDLIRRNVSKDEEIFAPQDEG